MIPAGYMLKRVSPRPSWIKSAHVIDLFSVSSCISEDFADYIDYWRHNGFWLFNKPSDMDEIVAREVLNLEGLKLFYYEVFDRQFDEVAMHWSSFSPDASFMTNVEKPRTARLVGFDVVSFGLEWPTISTGPGVVGTIPECSPLSCNALADELPVNAHCLFETFLDAKEALELGKFNNSEPGPFRIFSVYTVEA